MSDLKEVYGALKVLRRHALGMAAALELVTGLLELESEELKKEAEELIVLPEERIKDER